MATSSPFSFNRLAVYSDADGGSRLLGDLSYNSRSQESAWQWSPDALQAGLEWSPLNFKLSASFWQSSEQEKDLHGLPGLIHDALPDGWGLILMNKSFVRHGIPLHQITPLLQLAFLHDRCWGSLRFESVFDRFTSLPENSSLSQISSEVYSLVEGKTDVVSTALLLAGGSPHGARPKIMVGLSQDGQQIISGTEKLPLGYRPVMIKFNGEGETKENVILEHAYVQAALRCGLSTTPSTLLEADKLLGICTARFDRQHEQKQHVHSMAGLLHISHRLANADWEHVAVILKTLVGGYQSLEEAFRRAVFNAVFCVRDDHTKNIAFIRNASGQWSLTPAYDLCYSVGPGGYHSMTYAGHRQQNVFFKDLLNLAPAFNVFSSQCREILEQTQAEVLPMLAEAKNLGVTKSFLNPIQHRLAIIAKDIKMPASYRLRSP